MRYLVTTFILYRGGCGYLHTRWCMCFPVLPPTFSATWSSSWPGSSSSPYFTYHPRHAVLMVMSVAQTCPDSKSSRLALAKHFCEGSSSTKLMLIERRSPRPFPNDAHLWSPSRKHPLVRGPFRRSSYASRKRFLKQTIKIPATFIRKEFHRKGFQRINIRILALRGPFLHRFLRILLWNVALAVLRRGLIYYVCFD